MRFIKPDTHVDFVGKSKYAYAFSITLILLTIASLIIKKGPNLGIDFAGGTQLILKFENSVQIKDIKAGFAKTNLPKVTVQRFDNPEENKYIVIIDSAYQTDEDFIKLLEKNLDEATKVKADIISNEMVGPQVGKDLSEKALLAIFFSLLFITIYISWRFELKLVISAVMTGSVGGVVWVLHLFHVPMAILIICALIVTLILFWWLELKSAMGAIVALIHDVTITVGIFSITNKEFTLPIIAALLTIIGYSLNDTIIVFDRIRENRKRNQKDPLDVVINHSINETLSRTILTSFTTLLVVIILFLFGGGVIHDFAFALLVGIVIGTYSSIYVASPILIAWQKRPE